MKTTPENTDHPQPFKIGTDYNVATAESIGALATAAYRDRLTTEQLQKLLKEADDIRYESRLAHAEQDKGHPIGNGRAQWLMTRRCQLIDGIEKCRRDAGPQLPFDMIVKLIGNAATDCCGLTFFKDDNRKVLKIVVNSINTKGGGGTLWQSAFEDLRSDDIVKAAVAIDAFNKGRKQARQQDAEG